MKLLILTQKVDSEDDVLGFMHHWIEELAKRCQTIVVICLWQGRHNLPANVKVLSLGKEKERSKIKHLFRFYRYIWQEKKCYEIVFVHMNKEYVVLGGLWWRLLNKKIVLWYNHRQGNLWSLIAGWFAHKIFYTSSFSFFARSGFKKAQIMPAGIDTEIFKRQEMVVVPANSVFSLGRISPIKNIETLIETANFLDKKNLNFILNIGGEAGEKDKEYFARIKKLARELEIKGKINFLGKIPHNRSPAFYNQNEFFINLTNAGSLDKTALEAMACERLVLVSNAAFSDIFPDDLKGRLIFQEKNSFDLSEKLSWLAGLNQVEREVIGRRLRAVVIEKHSLEQLVARLIEIFEALN
jgi:glycosyltransferase involved in cell wall biosynthesis